jgi:hypothetical protein
LEPRSKPVVIVKGQEDFPIFVVRGEYSSLKNLLNQLLYILRKTEGKPDAENISKALCECFAYSYDKKYDNDLFLRNDTDEFRKKYGTPTRLNLQHCLNPDDSLTYAVSLDWVWWVWREYTELTRVGLPEDFPPPGRRPSPGRLPKAADETHAIES